MGPGAWPTAVAGTRFTDVRHLAEVDSTNRLVLDEAAAGAPEGLVVVADHQSAGRGRLGRRWEAPAGANLLVSVLLRPALAWPDLHSAAVAVALAAAEACRRVAGVPAACKWPNDLVVGDRKVAGILSETLGPTGGPGGGRAGGPAAVVVGLGLNVAWHPPDPAGDRSSAPSGVPEPGPEGAGTEGTGPGPMVPALATSLEREAGRPVDRLDVLVRTLHELERRLGLLSDATGRAELAAEYRCRSATLGRRVAVLTPAGRLEGTAVDLTPAGALVVEVAGERREVAVGDVVHLRPLSGPG